MIRIAVADDDADLREAVAAMLEREGYRVDLATGGRQCLDLVDDGGIDLVVTDVFMPDCDGLSLLAAIRNRHPHLPVIAMTGGLDGLSRPYLDAMRALGAQTVLAKPFSRHELTEAAAQALAQASGHWEIAS